MGRQAPVTRTGEAELYRESGNCLVTAEVQWAGFEARAWHVHLDMPGSAWVLWMGGGEGGNAAQINLFDSTLGTVFYC